MSASYSHQGHPIARGFTLIELMIVVAIIAILSSIAYPAYTDYIRRGQLPEAFTTLSNYSVRMEQYYQDNRSYGCTATTTPPAGTHFTFACDATGGQTYTLTATGSSGAVGGATTNAHVYTIAPNGVKTTPTFKGTDYTSANGCWFSKSATCD